MEVNMYEIACNWLVRGFKLVRLGKACDKLCQVCNKLESSVLFKKANAYDKIMHHFCLHMH